MPGGLMRTNIPAFRLPETRARRGDRLHRARWARRSATTRASTACASCSRPAASTRCSSAAARRRARNSNLPGRAEGGANIHIGIDWLESVAFEHIDKIGETRADHRRRQHRDGLLPLLAAPRREGRQGHGAQAAPVLQGVRLGTRGRRRRERRDRRQPLAEGVRGRERQAHRHAVRADGIRLRRAAAASRPSASSASSSSRRRRDPRDRPGKRVPVDRERSRHRVRQVARAGGRHRRRSSRRGRTCSSAATPRSARRTSSGRSSTATRPPSRSTTSAWTSPSRSACRRR